MTKSHPFKRRALTLLVALVLTLAWGWAAPAHGVHAQGTNQAPAFPAGPLARSVAENSAAGANAGEPVTATDANDDTLTYSLGGTDSSAFSIVADSGQIQVGSGTSLDFEGGTTSYTVTVTAADPSGETDTVTVNINVSNVNEAPSFPISETVHTVHENAAGGTGVGTPVLATDPEDDTLTYTLHGADAATFAVDSSTGQLEVAAGTTIGAAGSSYSVTVIATDPSGAAATLSVTVNVTRRPPPAALPGPPVRGFGDSLCMGFPGCPDSYLFLFPTLAVMGVAGLSWRGRRRVPNVYVLLGVWLFSMAGSGVLLDANPLRAAVYVIVSIMVGVVWLAFGGARR